MRPCTRFAFATRIFAAAAAIVLLGVSTLPAQDEEEDRKALSERLSRAQAADTLTELPPIPETAHASVNEALAKMKGAQRERVAEALVRYGQWRGRLVPEIGRARMPEDLLALAFVESAYKPKALSRSDAAGFWQILPATARLHGMRRDAFVDERFAPEAATRFAMAYLRALHEQFGDWFLAMAAYNLGKGNLERILETGAPRDFFRLRDQGLLRAETADYVPRILAARRILKDPNAHGFTEPMINDEAAAGIVLRPLTDTARLEMLAGAPGGTIRAHNPELRTDFAPPDAGGFRVQVPARLHDALEGANAKGNAVADWKGLRGVRRVVVTWKKDMTLFSFARAHDTSLSSLRVWNGLAEEQVPTAGDEIVVYVPDEF